MRGVVAEPEQVPAAWVHDVDEGPCGPVPQFTVRSLEQCLLHGYSVPGAPP